MAKKAKKKAVNSSGKRAKAKTKKAPRPKPQRLTGMEDVPKDRVLDQLCESIADSRQAINEGRDSEAAARGNALARMEKTDTTIYRAHGVELIYVKGEAKLKVKLVDSDEGGEDEDNDEDPEAVSAAAEAASGN